MSVIENYKGYEIHEEHFPMRGPGGSIDGVRYFATGPGGTIREPTVEKIKERIDAIVNA